MVSSVEHIVPETTVPSSRTARNRTAKGSPQAQGRPNIGARWSTMAWKPNSVRVARAPIGSASQDARASVAKMTKQPRSAR